MKWVTRKRIQMNRAATAWLFIAVVVVLASGSLTLPGCRQSKKEVVVYTSVDQVFYPPGGEPLTVRLFTLEANGPPAVVAALAVTQVAMTAAALALGALFLPKGRSE